MGCILVVANQTLGGAELDAAIMDCVGHGQRTFHVLVPMVAPDDETAVWAPADPAFGIPVQFAPTRDAVDTAQQRSQHRLEAMLTRIRALGGTAEGQIADPDPVVAVEAALATEDVDGVVVSTLPAGLSRWIRMDVVSRIQRLTTLPVTRVEAEAPAGG